MKVNAMASHMVATKDFSLVDLMVLQSVSCKVVWWGTQLET